MLDKLIAPKEPMAYGLDMPARKRPSPKTRSPPARALATRLIDERDG
jgi:hypothetical protein